MKTDSSADQSHTLNQASMGPEVAEMPTITETSGIQSAIPGENIIDFSSTLDTTTLQLRKQVPRELVVTMFQKMVSSRCFLQQ